LIAPDLLLAEFAGLMAKCAPRLFDMRPQLPRALDLSLQYRLSLWDCVSLALALEHDCPVLTADRRGSGA
jgi:predicted nucleic acid-binding protein